MDLNVKHNTVKLLEENIEGNPWKPRTGKEFLNMTPKARYIKEKR